MSAVVCVCLFCAFDQTFRPQMPGFGSQVLWSSRAGVGIVALTNVDK